MSARFVRYTRYLTFQMAEVAIPMVLLEQILARIARVMPPCYKGSIFPRGGGGSDVFGGGQKRAPRVTAWPLWTRVFTVGWRPGGEA